MVWKIETNIASENIDEFGLPSFITSCNGKPLIIRNTDTVSVHEDYADMTINVQRFASLPKKGLSMLMDSFNKMDIVSHLHRRSRR